MKALIAVALALSIAGCASTAGVKVTEDQTKNFKVGVTTESQIIAALGNPTSVLTSRLEGKVLIYSQATHKTNAATFIPVVGLFAGGGSSTGNITTIFLNPDKTLKGIDTSATNSNYKLNN